MEAELQMSAVAIEAWLVPLVFPPAGASLARCQLALAWL